MRCDRSKTTTTRTVNNTLSMSINLGKSHCMYHQQQPAGQNLPSSGDAILYVPRNEPVLDHIKQKHQKPRHISDVGDFNDNIINHVVTFPEQVTNNTNNDKIIDTSKNMTANVEDVVESRSYQKVTMTKGKGLSGPKKRENKVKPTASIGMGQNGVNVSTNVQTPIPTSCAMSYNNKSNKHNLSKPVLNEHLRAASTSKGRTCSSIVNSPATIETIAGISSSAGGASLQTTNMPASQYYVLSKIIHQQQKKMLQPAADLLVVKQIGTSLKEPILATTATTATTLNTIKTTSSNSTMGTRSTNITNTDQSNYKMSNVEETMCQCHLLLDPYPSQLSWRSTPNLQHYCRVCNTQLNSCKQAQIHTEGKKHEKRLAYLKFSIETGLQNATFDQTMNQPFTEYGNFPQDGMVTGQSQTSTATKSSFSLGSGILGEYGGEAISQPKPSSASGTANIATTANETVLLTNSHQLQGTSNPTPSSAIPNGTTTQLLPTLLPPIPPPPLLPPALAAAAAAAVTTGATPPFIPSFVQFQTSPASPYYFQPHNSARPPLSVPSSTHYNTSLTGHLKASETTQYQEFLGNMSNQSTHATTDASSNNTAMFQLINHTSNSLPTEAQSPQQQASVMSPPMIPPMFSQTIMTVPNTTTASFSSANCNINETVTSTMPSNTQLSSVNYNNNDPVNYSMPSQNTDQSFTTDNSNGLALQHLSNTCESINCHSQNAIGTTFYTGNGSNCPFYDNTGAATGPSINNVDNKYRATYGNGSIKAQKEKRGNSASHKGSGKKVSSSTMVPANDRSSISKGKQGVEPSGIGANSDGYISSVSQSSTRFSSHGRSVASSANVPSKSSKGSSNSQSMSLYQNLPKQKQQKCQSLDRSSDSDFTSNGGGISSKKKEMSSSTITTCDLCKLTFPSKSVLDNHLKGSRHARRVKSQQAFRQLQDNGTTLRQNIIHEDGTIDDEVLHFGEICCEVCEVSVNSSHQLQAHLEGHKHKVRCFRRGLHPSTAVIAQTTLLPSSSTPPSTAPSECSSTVPRSTTSFKYNHLSTSQYDTGTTTSSNNSYCLSKGTNSEGSRGNKKVTNNKASLLGEPPPLHTSLLQNSVLNSATPIYPDNQGDGLLPLPNNIKPLAVHSNPLTINPMFQENTFFANNKNIIQGMLAVTTSNNVTQGGGKSKSTKKLSRPSRTNTNAVRRYSTTESDDQIESRKVKNTPPLDKHVKDTILKSDAEVGAGDASAMKHSSTAKNLTISAETKSSSSTAFQDIPVIPFPISLPEVVVPVDRSINDATSDQRIDNDNTAHQNHDCNISFISSSDEAKESSEADSDRVSGTPLHCSLIPNNKEKLEGNEIALLDPLKTIKGNSLVTSEIPRSPTGSKPTITAVNALKPPTSLNGNVPNKIVSPFSCDMCNVIVNSAAQLTQHMNSPRHHVKLADCKTKAEQQKKEEQQQQQSDNNKLKEIPMLNMFLKTLQPPPSLQTPSLPNSTSTCSSGNSQYFSSDKEGEGDSSSNTEVER